VYEHPESEYYSWVTLMNDWWKGAVVYQVYPRSYQDDNGDGVGDLKGITRRLPHIASLGADAVWLSPIFTSPMKDMGYDVSDYCDIDPQFGTLSDFDDLIAKAHDLGLKIIIDQVLSHTSNEHPWFKESRSSKDNAKADWYVWAECNEDGTPPNNWPSVFGGSAWEWDTSRRQYYLHNFLIEQPDLNFHNTEVQDALLETMRFWLDRGVDGFRLDTVNFYFHDKLLRNNPPEQRDDPRPEVNLYGMQDHIFSKTQPENIGFLQRMRALLDEYEGRTMVGEVGEGRRAVEVMAEYTKGNDRLHMAYSFGMLSPDFTAKHFRNQIQGFFDGAPDGWPCWSFSNHDVKRHVTRWLPHAASQDAVAKQAISMLVGFEGTLGIYQGEETGQLETVMEYHELTDPPGIRFWPDETGRDGCRTPMVWDASENGGFSDVKPWLPVKAPQHARSIASQEGQKDSVLEHYRSALSFRKENETLVSGKTRFLDAPEPILAFVRGSGSDALLCVYNLSADTAEISLTGLGDMTGPSLLATIDGNVLSLGANGAALIKPATTGEAFALAN